MKSIKIYCAMSMLALSSIPMQGNAQLSDDHGMKLAAHGLGQTHPSAISMSHDPNWVVYGFERDGISYYQVNDLAGRVHVVVGRAGDTFWALPAGDVPFRASLPSRRVSLPEGATRSVVLRQPAFSILRYEVGGDAVWSIEVPGEVP